MKKNNQRGGLLVILLLFTGILFSILLFKSPYAAQLFNSPSKVYSSDIDFDQCQNEVKNYKVGVRVNFGVFNSSTLLSDPNFRGLRAGIIRVPMLVKDPEYAEQNAEEIEFIDNAIKCGYFIIYVYNPNSPLSDLDIKSDLSQILDRIPYSSKFAIEVGNEPNSSWFWTPSSEGLEYGMNTFSVFARQTIDIIRYELGREDIQIIIGALDLQWSLEDYLNSDDKSNHILVQTIKEYHRALSEQLGPIEDQNFFIAVHGYHYPAAVTILTDLHRYYLHNKTNFIISEAGITTNDYPEELRSMLEKSLQGEHQDVNSVIIHEYNGGFDQLGDDYRLTDEYNQPREAYWVLQKYIQDNTF